MSSSLISTSNGSPACGDHHFTSEPTSIHSALIEEIHDIPMKDISRPLPSTLDETKVESIIETIQTMNSDRLPPIDVLWYEAPNSGNNYYFAMGGCHRWEAHKRLNLPTIRAKLIQTTLNDLKVYFGSSFFNLQ
ncbi:unnamed protein product [Adineta ricciae]|uniref:Sulfiredoxin n=1 Tax=Adineta ricciae TaxID=249248 RepID=A0A813YJC6_ADIRI|nr:unnamed protein product [Adineta ricciae]CAF1119398.1 unnamed protein product [Adineta ricciae]